MMEKLTDEEYGAYFATGYETGQQMDGFLEYADRESLRHKNV